MRILTALLVAVFGSACARTPAPPPDVPVNARFGWVGSGCFAIANSMLTDGTPLTVVALGDRSSVVDVRVIGRGTPERNCPVRAAAATAGGDLSFYTLSRPIEVGIGIVGPVDRLADGIDVNGDKRTDQFTRCAASEGISYGVWTNGSYVGKAFWSGYEYLGYDLESDCPR